ncbi:acyl carrier protein [Candidatus Pacearchaeota archaeon]|nr:acyl carrier protein [Candidatus Pacearchaeota archaeon]
MALDDEVWQEIIVPVVANQLGIEPVKVERGKSLVNDYNADSLDIAETVMNTEEAVEKRYHLAKFTIPDSIEPEPRNLGEFCSYISKRIADEQSK